MNRILVTPRSLTDGHPEVERLRQAGFEIVLGPAGRLPEEGELLRLVPGCIGWLAGVETVSTRVLAAATRLKVISRNGTGVDNVPLAEAEARGIRVVRAAGANAQGVAELTIGLALAAVRSFHLSAARLREGDWSRVMGGEIGGRNVLVVGYGKIGRIVAGVFSALDAALRVVEPTPASTEPFPKVTLAEGLPWADLVTLHCPPPAGGRALLGSAELGSMRPGSILINTARRALVDEEALRGELGSDRLAAYASDVFESGDGPAATLLAHPRVIATPHLGAYTRESTARAAREAVDNLLQALRDADP